MSGESPVIIMGAARSGTTMLAEVVLCKHDDLYYRGEPNHIWRAVHPYRTDDLLDVGEVSTSYIQYVRNSLLDTNGNGLKRLLEKTPANCIRGAVVHSVYPDAKFLHVIRDGRDVVRSAAKEWAGVRSNALDSRALRDKPLGARILHTLFREADFVSRLNDWRQLIALPFYFLRFTQMLRRQVFNNSRLLWGPRVPGLAEVRRSSGLYAACAFQWEYCTRAARSFGRTLPVSQYMEVKYEELVTQPELVIPEILRFLNLSPFDDETLLQITKRISRGRYQRSRSGLTSEDTEIEYLVSSYLMELGYIGVSGTHAAERS